MPEELTPEDKTLFLKVWRLQEGELTDEEIAGVERAYANGFAAE